MESGLLRIYRRVTRRPRSQSSSSPNTQSCPSNLSLSSYETVDTIKRAPLCNLFLLGTHDSGAYKFNTKWGFSIDRPELKANILLRLFYLIGSKVVYRYSLTQKHNIYKQLQLGARYLDLRVGVRPEDKQLYIVHNLYGPPLDVILEQVARFLDENRREIVVLDFQHLHGFQSSEDHLRLMKSLVSIIKMEKIIAPVEVAKANELTLERLWNMNKQVIVVYRNTFQNNLECQHLYCNNSLLPNPWANTCDPTRLVDFLEAQLEQRQSPQEPLRMFVTQAVLTPHIRFVFAHADGSLRKLVAHKSNEVILDLLKRKYPLEAPNPQVPSTLDRAFGANIIMIDFLERNQIELADYCYRLNHKYFR